MLTGPPSAIRSVLVAIYGTVAETSVELTLSILLESTEVTTK
jgi:hypothetical protein